MLALSIAVVFAGLALLHGYWLAGGGIGLAAAIPVLDGAPAFQPSRLATGVVALALAGCAVLMVAIAGLVPLPVPGWLLRAAAYALAAVLLLRSIGDFRLVGFFKRIRDSRFARLDTLVYSPLCLLLGLGILAALG